MAIEELKKYGLIEMDREEIRNFLLNRGFGVLGLSTEKAPYLIPMSFGYDGKSNLYFSFFVDDESRKKDLVDRTDQASFLVFSADSVFFWESVSMIGTIHEIGESEINEHQEAFENAWHLDLFERAGTPGKLVIYRFQIEEQKGVKFLGLPPGLEQ